MRPVLLVASVAQRTGEDVFRICAREVGDVVTALPDGELGDRANGITVLAYRGDAALYWIPDSRLCGFRDDGGWRNVVIEFSGIVRCARRHLHGGRVGETSSSSLLEL
jgi:hypothetical protein